MSVQNTMRWVVIKFGGTSVSSEQRWQNIAEIIKKHLDEGRSPLVVCSAISGVSNAFERILANPAVAQAQRLLSEIEQKHRDLACALQVDSEALARDFQALEQLLEGLRLTGEVTPRLRARILAYGELMLTQLGAEFLRQNGVSVHWQDVREWLTVENHADFRHPDAYLNARCAATCDETLIETLNQLESRVVITQGFIANNTQGETVLFGRGGSDSSAAYLAAKLAASGCEIWTDVPGIYSANPKQIPQAKLITQLEYDEAQELASMGAKVLHPKCITPVREAQIPLFVKFTLEPQRTGTEISHNGEHKSSQIKSIQTKHNLILISIETLKMWQQVGFLAHVFQAFKHHGLSVDLVSTSESSVTVSFDAQEDVREKRALDALLSDSNQFACATVIAPCASVSLVGRNIRSILHQIGGIFSVFEEQKIYLLSQAANDLNLTFVVDEEQAPRLAAKLHHLLIEKHEASEHFHLSWQEEFGEKLARKVPWWQTAQKKLLSLVKEQGACYVYSSTVLQARAKALKQCSALDSIYYSMKANNNSNVLQILEALELGFECVSPQELKFVLELFPEIDCTRISFTPNFASKAEYEFALAQGVYVTVDSSYPLLHWPEVFSGQEILVRVDIGKGSGHHKYVVTGGDQSKFGIPLSHLEHIVDVAKRHQIKIIGLHSHAGSGILDALHWQQVLESLINLIPQFPEIKFLNLGGGLGVAERSGQEPLDLAVLNTSLKEVKAKVPQIKLWLEPGRFLVAESGVLLARVTQLKEKGNVSFVGIETGMNSLLRPALYGAYHEIVNLTRLHEPATQRVNIVGPICESGDTLGYSRKLPPSQEGDVILIATAGAYGRCMSSHYNLRPPATEIVIV